MQQTADDLRISDWISDVFSSDLLPSVRSVLVRSGNATAERGAVMAATPPLPTFEPPAAPAAPSPFDAKLGFDRFIVARSNIPAANAARRMAMEEAPQFNPLYLCSGTGQGKTHLLHAIAQIGRAHV